MQITQTHIDQKLRKEERLTQEKPIEELFAAGKSFKTFPLKIIYQQVEPGGFPVQAMFIAPKRQFKQATQRNYVRRLMRESYRKNKHSLYAPLENLGKKINIAFLYLGQEPAKQKDVEFIMKKALKKCLELVLADIKSEVNTTI